MTVQNEVITNPVLATEAGEKLRISRADFIWFGGVSLHGEVSGIDFLPNLEENADGEVIAQTRKILGALAYSTAKYYEEWLDGGVFGHSLATITSKFALEEDTTGYKNLYVASAPAGKSSIVLTSQPIQRHTDGSWFRGEQRNIKEPNEQLVALLRKLGKSHLDPVLANSFADVHGIRALRLAASEPAEIESGPRAWWGLARRRRQ